MATLYIFVTDANDKFIESMLVKINFEDIWNEYC